LSSSCIVGATKRTGQVTKITRIAVAYEAGRDGFWLARWLMARGLEADVAGRRRIRPAGHARGKTNATTMMIAENG
jgi:transposase